MPSDRPRAPRTSSTSTAPVQITGRLSVHPRGFGFVVGAPGGTLPGSIFVPPPEMRGLMADDRVGAEVIEGDDGRLLARKLVLVERLRVLVYGEAVSRRGQLSLRVDPEIATGESRPSFHVDGHEPGGIVAAGRPRVLEVVATGREGQRLHVRSAWGDVTPPAGVAIVGGAFRYRAVVKPIERGFYRMEIRSPAGAMMAMSSAVWVGALR